VQENEGLTKGIEELLCNYVFDELSSKIEFMKARALLIYSKYKLKPFTDEHVYEAGKMVM
jgi:hypothetical protein